MIDKYIKELLSQEKSVSIPNFGTFVVTSENAQTDSELNVIQPPNHKISFDTDTNGDADLLKNAVMTGEHLDEDDYALRLNKFIEVVDAQIVTFGEYKFHDLGILTKNDEGQLIFEPKDNAIGDGFGLPPVNAEPISKVPPKPEKKYDVEPQKAKMQGNNYGWLMVIIPLIFMLAFLIYVSTRKDGFSSLKAMFGTTTKVEKVVTDNTPTIIEENPNEEIADENPDDTEIVDETPAESELVEEEPAEEVVEAPVNSNESNNLNASSAEVSDIVSGKFYVVVGSFSTTKSAQPLVNKMSDVPNVKIVPYTAKNMYRVVIGEFDDEASATAKMNELSAKYGEMWITKM